MGVLLGGQPYALGGEPRLNDHLEHIDGCQQRGNENGGKAQTGGDAALPHGGKADIPLADEPVEGWNTRQGAGAGREAGEGQGHPPAQSLQL